jgi:uncharacterized membrane-anchored protein YitT (DUF2179 family)
MAKRKIFGTKNRFTIKDMLFIGAGIISACIGLEGFLLPSHFIDGGVVGVALIVNHLTHIPFSILLLVLSLPFIWLGRASVSKIFAWKTLIAIIIYAIALWSIEMPALTRDPLLVAVFGGFFLGLGVGLAIRGGAVLDGTEVLALFLSRKSSITVGDFILVINVLIFVAAIFVFNLETALYAMLTYLCASRTVDYVVYGIEEFMCVQVFSDRSPALYKVMKKDLHLDVMVMHGQRSMPHGTPEKHHPVAILQVIVTRLDLARVLNAVQSMDHGATIIYHPVTDMHKHGSTERASVAQLH